MFSDKRKSGILTIGELPWGSHICQFYRTEQDLLEIVIPYLEAGLENNEYCLWIVPAGSALEDARSTAGKLFPGIPSLVLAEQLEVLDAGRWRALRERPESAIDAFLDKAVTHGFDGLRIARLSAREAADQGFAREIDQPAFRNTLTLSAYPHGDYNAAQIVEVIKDHRFALVKNAGAWEIIEGSEVRAVQGDLLRSEEKLRSLFSNMLEGFAYHRIILDRAGRPTDYAFLEVNQAFERLTGLTSREVIGRKATEVIPGIEQDPADWIGIYGKVAMTGEPAHFENYSRSLGKWFSVSAFCPRKGFFGVTFTDITGRKNAEEEIRKLNDELKRKFDELSSANASLSRSRLASLNLMEDAVIARRLAEETSAALKQLNEELEIRVAQRTRELSAANAATKTERQRLYNVLETLPVYVILLAQDHQVYFANRFFRERFGESGGKRCYEFLFKSAAPCENCQSFKPIATGVPHAWEWEGPDGRSYEIHDYPFTDADGTPLILEMGIDITARKQAEEENRRLAAALESAADAAVITHPATGVIEYANQAFEKITGYARAEALGRPLEMLVDGMHEAGLFRDIRASLDASGVWQGQLTSRRKDGTTFYEDRTCAAVRDAEGAVANIITFIRDITDRLKLESVAASVSQLDNIGAVFAGVRHEIGNPINNAKMMLTVLQQKLGALPPERVRYYVDRTLDELRRVEVLLHTLKTFRLFELPQLETLDTARVLGMFRDLSDEYFRERSIRISIDVRPGAERLRGDSRALQHVLLNLATNAADALAGRSEPRIEIQAARENARIRIAVTDNGCGITAEQVANLFKPFQTTKENGTGLGLVIVKKMLTAMNGDITITSLQGKGTVAIVLLPCAES